MKQRLLVAGSCLLAVAAFAAGCGGSDTGGDSGNDQGGTPATSDEGGHKGGTLTMLWSAPGQSIDTAIAYDANWQVLRMTGDALLGWKQVEGTAGNELVPDLAESIPEPTDGGKTYAFTMREGIKFSTGETVKPSDIRYTIERNFKAAGPRQRLLREHRRRRRLREEAEDVRPVEGHRRRRRRQHRHLQAHRARPRHAAEAGDAVRVRGAQGHAEQGHRHRPAPGHRART